MRHGSRLPNLWRSQTALGRHVLKAVRLLVITSMIYSLFLPGSLPRANAQDGELPFIVASEAGDWFWTSGFSPGADLALSIYESPESDTPLWSGSRTADEGGFVAVVYDDHMIDMLPGYEVRVSDSAHEKRVVLEIITMEVFDTENEIMAGTAPIGREVSAAAGPQEWQERIMVVADPVTGAWLADFKTIDFDITEDMRPWSSAAIFDADGDVNEASTPPPPPNPRFTVFPEWEFVEGWEWPEGAVVHLEIDDPDTEASPDYEQDGTVGVHPSDPNVLWVSYNFAGSYDVKAGDLVMLTEGETTREHTVQALDVTGMDKDENTVAGTADPGAEVHIWPHGYDELLPVAGEDGQWLADFDEIGIDLVEGMCGRANIRDASGNDTAVDWCVPNPRFTVFPEWEFVEGWEWPEGATVHLEIDDPGTAESPDYQEDQLVGPAPWDPNTIWVSFSFVDYYNVKAGDVVTLSDGKTTRVHTVQNLTVTGTDPDENTVSGAADPGAEVHVWPHGYAELLPVAGEDGQWLADLDENGFDLVEGVCGRSEIRDEVGNTTAVDWCVPNPRIVYRYHQYVVAEQFTPGAEITFWFYESGNISFVINRTADASGHVNIPIWELPSELVPGNEIVVSDGTTTKTLILESISMEIFDPELNLLAGTAAPGEYVYVYVQNDHEYCYLELTADDNGDWTADFVAQPCDVTADMWGAAQVFDEDGDVSEVGVLQAPTGYHDYDFGDVPNWACNVGGWAIDPDNPFLDINVRILVDGAQVGDEVTANTYRPDLEISWNEGGGGCPDGTCAFEVSLWDSISHYELHEITVEAQDLQSGDWYPLNATPKTLTCRTYDIYIYDTLTGESRPLTNLPDSIMMDSWEFNPRWSPDGRHIVHDRWDMDFSDHGIYITDVRTGESVPLAGGERGSYPTWSPNGQWIAFDRGADEDYRLFIVPPTGGEAKLVIEDAFMASWAPSSRRLAFHHPSDGSIRTTDLNGGKVTLVVERGNAPVWSPNGQWIAYEVDGDLWKVRVDIRGVPLGDPIQLTSGEAWEGRPSWSPDGRTIVFHAGYDTDMDIWTIPAAGGTASCLTCGLEGGPDFPDYDPNYSNNGRYIAYSSYTPIVTPEVMMFGLSATASTVFLPAILVAP